MNAECWTGVEEEGKHEWMSTLLERWREVRKDSVGVSLLEQRREDDARWNNAKAGQVLGRKENTSEQEHYLNAGGKVEGRAANKEYMRGIQMDVL